MSSTDDSEHQRVAAASKSKEVYAEISQPVKITAACFSMLGIGCSAAYYVAAAGFFQQTFKSQTYFLWMIMALYLPYPVTLILQHNFDGYFDRLFAPRQTYFFRVVICQLYSVGAFFGLALCYGSPSGVLVCGIIIGFLSAACLASTMQLMSSWDLQLIAWASLGRELGTVLPVVTYYMLDFQASTATMFEFQRMQIFPGAALFLCSLCGTFMHFSGVWDKAYSRLGYDLFDDFESDERAPRLFSESDPLLDQNNVDEYGVPLWMSRWLFAMGYNTFLTFLLIPLTCFRGNPDITQQLTLGKLLMDCLARAIAACTARTDIFGLQQPRHYLLIAQQALRTLLFTVLLLSLVGVLPMRNAFFMCVWLIHYFDGSFVASQIEVTTVRFAPVAMRKAVSRRNSQSNYSGLGLALILDVIIVISQ